MCVSCCILFHCWSDCYKKEPLSFEMHHLTSAFSTFSDKCGTGQSLGDWKRWDGFTGGGNHSLNWGSQLDFVRRGKMFLAEKSLFMFWNRCLVSQKKQNVLRKFLFLSVNCTHLLSELLLFFFCIKKKTVSMKLIFCTVCLILTFCFVSLYSFLTCSYLRLVPHPILGFSYPSAFHG